MLELHKTYFYVQEYFPVYEFAHIVPQLISHVNLFALILQP